MAIKWGSIVGSGSSQARLGINVTVENISETQAKRVTEIWFWSKYRIYDTGNTFYYNDNATSATSSKGSVSINTSVSSGEGWSTSNQQKLKTYTYTFNRSEKASTRPVSAKLTGVYSISGALTVSTTYTIPALPSYSVKYNANGGTGAPSSQIKYHDKPLKLSAIKPTRSGYTFVGWGSSADDTTPVNQPEGTYNGNKAYTYYAIWKKTITLAYDSNGGSGSPCASSVTVYNATTSKKFTISSTKPTRTGYTFLGWSTSSSAKSASFDPGDIITLSASDTLYAVWQIKTYKITYYNNGGTGSPTVQTKTYGTNIALSKTVPTRNGYRFLGWATSSTGGVSYSPGTTYKSNADLDLYAVWEKLGIMHIKVDGKWCNGRVWIKVNGVWKTGIVFQKVNGVWKQGGV